MHTHIWKMTFLGEMPVLSENWFALSLTEQKMRRNARTGRCTATRNNQESTTRERGGRNLPTIPLALDAIWIHWPCYTGQEHTEDQDLVPNKDQDQYSSQSVVGQKHSSPCLPRVGGGSTLKTKPNILDTGPYL